jgi:acyl-CoA thioesterase I
MKHQPRLRRWAMKFSLAAAVACVAAPAPAQTSGPKMANRTVTGGQPASCAIPAAETRFERPLPRTAQRVASGLPIKIVAMGSSSTEGFGASTAGASYPSRLAAYLAGEFPSNEFIVVNHGVSGDTAEDMLARFDNDVFAEKPDLVLWQVGTNSLLTNHPLKPAFTLLQAGLERLQAAHMDVVLIDPQYAPRVLAKPNVERMVAMMAQTAKAQSINIFHRFALMRYWHEDAGLPFRAFLSSDQLHMNDWSYGCVARALGHAIEEAVTRPVTMVGAERSPQRRPH